ncbi:MAG: LysR family transcriptional regulator [Alphaproteobacteria bacterium]|nr:LysR family transcriptional regulator [Alphaproteobacteria bacterium]MCW5740287.1 LysR family transcriptional regulator [Alphaproteobacteria bacterium]
MDRFLSIQAFVRVTEAQSFAEAARQLGVANSVVTQRIKQLEEFVGTPLFHRSTRSVKLSEAGATYYTECAELVARLDGLTDRMREIKGSPTGALRITVLPGFALGHLSRVLHLYQERYPDIVVDMFVNDRVVDPVEMGFDVALQLFEPASEALIARRIFPVRRMFLATPEYIASFGMPRRPEDLLRHRLGVYDGYPTRNHWRFMRGNKAVEIELPAHLRTNSVQFLKEHALTHAAIVCIPTIAAADDIIAGRLTPVLYGYRLSSYWLSAVYPTTHRHNIKVKLFVDFIAERFAGEPPWDQVLKTNGFLPHDDVAAEARPRLATTVA